MAGPKLQGYCSKCWSEKCLPSSSESGDPNQPSEPNLSSMTPLSDTEKTSSSVGARTSKDGKTVTQPPSGGNKGITMSVTGKGVGGLSQAPSDHLGTSNVGTPMDRSQPKVAEESTSQESIEKILSMTGVKEPPSSKQLTFWDVDGGNEGDTSQPAGKEAGEPKQTKTEKHKTDAFQSSNVGNSERSPSPGLEVLEDVKKPEPELITIDDTDDIPPSVTSKPPNRLMLKKVGPPPPPPTHQAKLPAIRYVSPSGLQAKQPGVRYASPPNQIQIQSAAPGGLAYILPPLHATQSVPNQGMSTVTQIHPVPVNRNTILTPVGTSTIGNGPPVRMAVVPNSASTSTKQTNKQVKTTYYVFSKQTLPGTHVAQQPPALNSFQIPASTSAPEVSTATSVASRPIILSKSPVKVTSQAARGTHVLLETHPVSKGSSSSSNVQGKQVTTVYLSPPKTTASRPHHPPSNSAQNKSSLWADWRKKITSESRPSSATSTPPATPLHSYARPVPKPPQPTRLLQIMSGQSATKPSSPQTVLLNTSGQPSGTPFTALLQHFNDQRQSGVAPTTQSGNVGSGSAKQGHQQGTSILAASSRQTQSTATAITKR